MKTITEPREIVFSLPNENGGEDGSQRIAARIFPPTSLSLNQATVIFCEHGGTYTWRYYHLEVPGCEKDEYTMAMFLASQGYIVVAFDNLGVGESWCDDLNGTQITPEVQARANHAMVQQVREQLRAGTLLPSFPAQTDIFCVGVGHSMEAVGIIVQQALHSSFQAIVLLGFGFQTQYPEAFPKTLADSLEVEVLSYDKPADMMRKSFHKATNAKGEISLPRTPLYLFFHAQDVPPKVIETDDTYAMPIPAGIANFIATSMLTTVRDYAEKITVPIFLGNGAWEISLLHFHGEAVYFPNTRQITSYVLEGSAHCHNFAPTRKILWERLSRWLPYSTQEQAEG